MTSIPTTPLPTRPFAAWREVAGRRPVAVVWFGTIMFSTGPVMVAAAAASGPVFSFWRLWFGTVLVGALAAVTHRRALRRGEPQLLTRAGLRWTAAAGIAFAIHQVMFMSALRATSVVDVTLMNTLAPVIVAVLAVSLFGERPGLRFRLWSLLAILGAGVVAIAGSTGPQGHPAGMALGAGNVAFYSLFFVWSKRARDHIDTVAFVAGMTGVAAIGVSVFVLLSGTDVRTATARDLALCLAVAALPGLVGHMCVTWAVKWVPANIPPIIMLSLPLFSGVLAWLALGQGTTWLKLAGGLVTLVGVGGAVRSPVGQTVAGEALQLASET